MILSKYTSKLENGFYFLFRLLIGGLFLMHGLQKFGVYGGQAVQLSSMMGAAGILEVIIGPLVILGLFTRLAALVGAVEMLVAYITVHFPVGWNPLENKGELALLFFVAFLVLLIYGAKKLSLEKSWLGKELF